MYGIKKLENLIITGSIESMMLKDLSQEKISYLVFFAYQNLKIESLDIILPYWRELKFNKGKNIIHLLLDNVAQDEKLLKDYIKSHIQISNQDLNRYKAIVNELHSTINQDTVKSKMKQWEDFFNHKMIENLSNKLNNSLREKNNKKLVKI